MDEEMFNRVMELYHHAAGIALKSTVKLYTKENGRMRPHGCGVLCRFGNGYYLFTAAHCIFQKGHQFKIACMDKAGHLHSLRGPVLYKREANSKIDVAVMKLSNQSVAAIAPAYTFLEGTTGIMLNHGIKEETEYLVTGHPNTKTSINFKTKRIHYEPLVHMGTSIASSKIMEYGFNPASHLCIGFNQRKSMYAGEQSMSMAPDPRGISGSGLWYIQSYDVSSADEIVVYLCGIMIEHHKDKSFMVATKCEELYEMVRKLLNIDPDTI